MVIIMANKLIYHHILPKPDAMGIDWVVSSRFDNVRLCASDPQDVQNAVRSRCKPVHAPAILPGNVPLAALWLAHPG